MDQLPIGLKVRILGNNAVNRDYAGQTGHIRSYTRRRIGASYERNTDQDYCMVELDDCVVYGFYRREFEIVDCDENRTLLVEEALGSR